MIRLLLFGSLAAKVGVRELDIEFKEGANASSIIKELCSRFPELPSGPYVIAVNEVQVDNSTKLSDNDVVAIMPPFAGG
jgi:molybdopterin synthase sulfur carrier subunit